MAANEVAAGVYRVESAGHVNWYLVEDGNRVAAVDAGLPPAWHALRELLAAIGRSLDDLEAVVLTHAHIDHTGFAEQARREAGATVLVGADERELVQHQLRGMKSERSPLLYMTHGAARTLMLKMVATGAVLSHPIRDYATFSDGDELADVPGRPRVVATPGHSFGHSALHLPERDVLFTGDALVTRDPYTGRTGPRLVARAATADVATALASLDAIAATRATTLLPGHGEPWIQGAEHAVELAREAGAA